MKIYAVGGSVRNEILGIPAIDNDYVCVGYTEQEMLDLGYSKVGANFPVFLHPETGEEYALARRERSTGSGYNDFEVEFSPDVTIEEDLFRRDFTMNAIAKDVETGELIDPYHGVEDIKSRSITVVNPEAFRDDPVRVLRLARFAAQYPSMKPDYETFELAEQMNIKDATPERVFAEMSKALMGYKPSLFFDILCHTNQAAYWFKEVSALLMIPAGPFKYHAEGSAYVHTMMVLDSAAKYRESLEVRFGALVHDFGKVLTPAHKLPSHPGHEAAGVPLVEAFCDRLKISNDLRNAGILSAKYHMHVHKADEMTEKPFVKMLPDFKKNEKDSWTVARVAWHDNEGKLPYESHGNKSWDFHRKIQKIREVKLSSAYTDEEIDAMSIEKRKETLHKMRINSIKPSKLF